VRALTEMIVFPLVYPEFFANFKMDAPRGVLFYGPPGTGKTLVARALANECSKAGKHVSFFMRKGADCVSKWIGESERMLRLLFDQAYKMRPSIIFFDEIDGLAPVRSSRTDSNYSSIVSTLLAMMDGLDSRGEVIVIGATVRSPCRTHTVCSEPTVKLFVVAVAALVAQSPDPALSGILLDHSLSRIVSTASTRPSDGQVDSTAS